MANNIYRKAALDKLSSPDQLDKTITIISPSFWIAMAGMGAMLLIALIWAIFGRIPVSVSTDGIYMDPTGVRTVAAAASGLVDEVYVSDGDEVTAGQKIAHIDTKNIEEELALFRKRRETVEKVTFDSEGDVGSADNKALLDLKAQKIVADQNLTANRAQLESRQQELGEQQAATDAARAEYEAAREEYLASMDIDGTGAEQLAYQDAQGALSTNRQYYESAKSTLAQATAQADAYNNQKTELQNSINQLNQALSQAQATAQQAQQELTLAQQQQQSAQARLNAATTEEEKAAAQAALEQATAAVEAAQAKLTEATNAVTNAQTQLTQAQSQMQQLDSQISQNASQVATNQQSVDQWKADVDQAQANYNAAEDAYIAAMNASTAQQGNTNKEGAVYNVALQNYTSELSARRNLESTVVQLMAQVASDQANLEKQNAALKVQFLGARASILDQLDQEIANRQKQVDNATITANRNGYVAAMNLAVGNPVQQGSTVCRISTDHDGGQVVICYAPVTQGRKLQVGMDVMVYPSTVNRQEYGHINAKVKEVSDYVISAEELANQLGDNSLVQLFQQRGPVVRVVCELEKDEKTVSGYSWSSNKGAEVALADGTIVSADVVTEYKAPISMIIPYLKEKLEGGSTSESNSATAANTATAATAA